MHHNVYNVSGPETIYIAKLKLEGLNIDTGTRVHRYFDIFVRAADMASAKAHLDALHLPGDYRIEPAILCADDGITTDILRQAKLARFEFTLRCSEAKPSAYL